VILSIEKVKELRKHLNSGSYVAVLSRESQLNLVDTIEAQQQEIEQLQEIAKAKAEWRLVELPCRVGDIVWAKEHTSYSVDGVKDFIHECKVTKIVISEKRVVFCVSSYGIQQVKVNVYAAAFTLSSFGKTIFLTKEEAEKSLKKRGDTQ
jgi:hypothetical protein